MTWLKALYKYGSEIASDLDKIVDHVHTAFEEHVAPVIRGAAQQLDRAIDEGLDVSLEGLEERVKQAALDLDDRYQKFMVRRVDPLFGQTRTEHLEEMGSLQISPNEVMLNRRIAYAGAWLLVLGAGRLFFPASLYVTAPASFYFVLPVFKNAYRSVKQQKRVTYHVVSALSVTATWIGGYYIPALAATTAYFMGEKLLMITEDRSHKGLISVFSKQPRTVIALRDGVEVELPLERILPGDTLVVHAGGYMPVDGTVVEGMASIDQQMLTGEAQPAEKAPGDPVFASTLVLAGKLQVLVDKAGTETIAAKIGDILNKTASYQFALQSKGSKLAHDSALPTLLLSGAALILRGPEAGLAILNSAFGVSVRMSAPVTMLNLLNIASRKAILLKDGRTLELLGDIDTVVFDKTGTLTLSRPNVARVHCAGDLDEDGLLTLAAAAECRQTHPIALAVLAAAEARSLRIPDIDEARYEVGYGIRVELEGRRVEVGSDRFMRLEGVEIPPEIEETQTGCHAAGHSLIMVAVDGRLAGAIELQPSIRPEAESVIRTLRARGLKIVIISGDQEGPTRRLAEQLGMDRYFADVLPEGKAGLVEQLQREGHAVCFVGDGINDSIALKKANVSVSLRGATTVATDAAQVVLMQESLRQLPFLFELGEDMERNLKLGYAAGMIPGVITVGGVFLLGWGYPAALGLSVLGLTAGLGIAVYPLVKYRDDLAKRTGAAAAPVARPHMAT